jgi:hypothetical protein
MLNSDETRPASDGSKRTGGELDYTFGRPLSTYLSPIQITRLTIVRSKLRDTFGDLTPTRDRLA